MGTQDARAKAVAKPVKVPANFIHLRRLSQTFLHHKNVPGEPDVPERNSISKLEMFGKLVYFIEMFIQSHPHFDQLTLST